MKVLRYKDMIVGHGQLHDLLIEMNSTKDSQKRKELQKQVDKLVAELNEKFHKHVPKDFPLPMSSFDSPTQ